MVWRSNSTRRMGMSFCCSVDRSTTPGIWPIALSTSLASSRSLSRSSPNTLTAMLARVPESMWSIRWPMGWPNCALTPGIAADITANGLQQLRPGSFRLAHADGAVHVQRQVDLAALRVHAVGVGLTPSGTPADGRDLRVLHERLLDDVGELVALLQRDAGDAHQADHQGTFAELRQEAASHRAHANEGSDEQDRCGRDDPPGMPHGEVQRAGVKPLDGSHEPGLAGLPHRLAPRQQVIAQRGRQRQCGHQRRDQGDDKRHAEREEQSAFHAGEEEQRHKDQQDDERGEDDRGIDLDAGAEDHLDRQSPLCFGKRGILSKPADDVLHVDDGIIDQGTDARWPSRRASWC